MASLCLAGMSSSTGEAWMLAPAGAFAAYSLFVPLGGAAMIASRRFAISALRTAGILTVFVACGFFCAVLINTPAPAVSIAGGVGMIGLLASSLVGATVLICRWVVRAGRAVRLSLIWQAVAARLELLVVAIRFQATLAWVAAPGRSPLSSRLAPTARVPGHALGSSADGRHP